MPPPFATGDAVQTPLGKGIVREVRNNGRVLVDVSGRAVVFDQSAMAPLDTRTKSKIRKKTRGTAEAASERPSPSATRAGREVDLHGLTVDEALARVEQAVNDALLADLPELRVIHGQSGGRIRASLHRWLRTIPSVRAFRIDPRNAGVTIVSL